MTPASKNPMYTYTKQTICQAADDYVIHLQAAGRAPATIESYEKSLALLARLLDHEGPLKTVTPSILDAAVAGMAGTKASSGGRLRLGGFRETRPRCCAWPGWTRHQPRP